MLAMERFVFGVVLVAAVVSAHKLHRKLPKGPEDTGIPLLQKVTCTNENSKDHEDIKEQSKCGTPKDVFIPLDGKAAHEQVTPGAVWVKRCVGLCEHDAYGSSCVPIKKAIRYIPIRIYNAKTNKDTCATYPVEEHALCGCCALSPEKCASPRVYNPRKCSCQCPNLEERRNCLKKRNPNIRWNRSKCACEERRRVP